MGAMKRIATVRQWNEKLAGDDPETVAMRKLWQSDQKARRRKPRKRAAAYHQKRLF